MDKSGALFGAAKYGGTHKFGIVFELTQSGGAWKEKVLYNFSGPDGAYPYAGLVPSRSETFYGTTVDGGADDEGTVFVLFKSGGAWTEAVLYGLGGGSGDGTYPFSAVILDKKGNLYGTTEGGRRPRLGHRLGGYAVAPGLCATPHSRERTLPIRPRCWDGSCMNDG